MHDRTLLSMQPTYCQWLDKLINCIIITLPRTHKVKSTVLGSNKSLSAYEPFNKLYY